MVQAEEIRGHPAAVQIEARLRAGELAGKWIARVAENLAREEEVIRRMAEVQKAARLRAGELANEAGKRAPGGLTSPPARHTHKVVIWALLAAVALITVVIVLLIIG